MPGGTIEASSDIDVPPLTPEDYTGEEKIVALNADDNPVGLTGNLILGDMPARLTAAEETLSELEVSGDTITVKTWSTLSGIVGSRLGQRGEVTGADAGTHTDPVVGGTVANVGIYSWSTSPAGWQWLMANDLPALQAQVDGLDDTVSALIAQIATDAVNLAIAMAGLARFDDGGDGDVQPFLHNSITGAVAAAIVRSRASIEFSLKPDGPGIEAMFREYLGRYPLPMKQTGDTDIEGWLHNRQDGFIGLGRVKATGAPIVMGHTLDVTGSGSASSGSMALAPLAPENVPERKDVNGAMWYGQSLTRGVNATPLVTTTALHACRTFGTGGAPTVATIQTTDEALYEVSVETPCSGAMAQLVAMEANEILPEDNVWFTATMGVSGTPIYQLKPGGGSYWASRFVAGVQAAFTIYKNQGKTFALQAVFMNCCQTDMVDGRTDQEIYDDVILIIETAQTVVASISANAAYSLEPQTTPVHFFFNQTFYYGTENDQAAARAIKRVVDDHPLAHFAVPEYVIQLGDGVHCANGVESNYMGRFYGRGLYYVMKGYEPPTVWPDKYAVVEGTKVTVGFTSPMPLMRDNALGEVDEDGTAVIKSDTTEAAQASRVISGRSVVINLGASPGADSVTRFGLDKLSDDLNIDFGTSLAIRDSTTDIVNIGGTEKKLFYPCPAFEIPNAILS